MHIANWASIIFGSISALFWLLASLVSVPAKVAPVFGGGGNIQVLADSVRKQSRYNAIGAATAALAIACQVIAAAAS